MFILKAEFGNRIHIGGESMFVGSRRMWKMTLLYLNEWLNFSHKTKGTSMTFLLLLVPSFVKLVIPPRNNIFYVFV